MVIPLTVLVNNLNGLLKPELFRDYCPNGLQVEGKSEIKKLLSGVTANQALIDTAIERGADAILVHHGYFWKGESLCVTGMKKKRIKTLLENDISLLAYHLPLDAHSEYGNNAQLAKIIGLEVTGPLELLSKQSIGFVGKLSNPMTAGKFVRHIGRCLNRQAMHLGDESAMIHSIGWCTGAAQNYIDKAIEQGMDAYLSGEISEQTVHSAVENNIHYFAAGHHATERYGVQAVGTYVAAQLGIEHEFVDIDNPV